MPAETLKKYLDENHIKYVTIKHSRAYTAQEIAEITHISAKEFAKSVVVKMDNQLALVVIPAHMKVDFNQLKKATGAKSVELATEFEFEQRFKGCELGAMPPFGNLFDIPVYVDKHLTDDEQIAFNAGSHAEIIKMNYQDFAKLVKPTLL